MSIDSKFQEFKNYQLSNLTSIIRGGSSGVNKNEIARSRSGENG